MRSKARELSRLKSLDSLAWTVQRSSSSLSMDRCVCVGVGVERNSFIALYSE